MTESTDDGKAGMALLVGTVGYIVTMAIHPTGGGPLTAAQADHLAITSGIAHSLAIVSCLPLLLGALGLTQRLTSREVPASRDRFAIAAFITFSLGVSAILIATAVSGFIGPTVIRYMITDSRANAPVWDIVLRSFFQFNQAFAKIYSVAASVAIVLWSVSALRNGGLGRGIARYGCILPPLVIALIAVGHLRLDVHGMAAVVVVQAIWFIVVGLELHQHPDAQAHPQTESRQMA